MRLSDAGMRRRKTKLLYLNHRLPPWHTEDALPRSLEPMVRGHPCTNLRKRLRTCSREDWQRRSTKETCRPEPCAARKLGELRETKRHLRGRQGTFLGQPTSQRHPKIRSCRKPRPKRYRLGTRYAILNRNAQRYVCRTSEADLQLPLGQPEPLDLPRMSEMASNDEFERRAGAPMTNEADLFRSSTPSLAHQRLDPVRSLEPLVRRRPRRSRHG